MITEATTKELYMKEYEAFLEFREIEKLVDEKPFEYFVNDWRKDIDWSLYNIDHGDSGQDSLLEELEAFKKFYLNSIRKYNKSLNPEDISKKLSSFKPVKSAGDVYNFIKNQIDLLNTYGTGGYAQAIAADDLLRASMDRQLNELAFLPRDDVIDKYNSLLEEVKEEAEKKNLLHSEPNFGEGEPTPRRRSSILTSSSKKPISKFKPTSFNTQQQARKVTSSIIEFQNVVNNMPDGAAKTKLYNLWLDRKSSVRLGMFQGDRAYINEFNDFVSEANKYNDRLRKRRYKKLLAKKISRDDILEKGLKESVNEAFSKGIDMLEEFIQGFGNSSRKSEFLKRLSGINIEGVNQINKKGIEIVRRVAQGLPEGEFTRSFLQSSNTLFFRQKRAATARSVGNLAKSAVQYAFNSSNRYISPALASSMANLAFDFLNDYGSIENLSRAGGRGLRTIAMTNLKRKINDVFSNPNSVFKPTDVIDSFIDAAKTIYKTVDDVKLLFKHSFEDGFYNLLNQGIGLVDWKREARRQVRSYGRQLFRAGVESIGLVPEEFKFIERIAIRQLNKSTDVFLDSLVSRLSKGLSSRNPTEYISSKIGNFLGKSEEWWNKTLKKFFSMGQLAADRNGLYEWVFGDTKHCPSCLYANGQRHRLKHWHQAGIMPQSNGSKDLICGGFYCQCKLVRVTGKARGRLYRIPTA